MTKNCIVCNKEFYNNQNDKQWARAKYCSRKCFYLRVVSEETRKKMSLTRKGRKNTWGDKIGKAIEGKNNGMYGKRPVNYKGGTKSFRQQMMGRSEYKLWRKAVFERDDYTCQGCGERGGRLEADHIKPWALYPELRYAIDNGRTLCHSCHLKTETYGYGTAQIIERSQYIIN